MSVIEPAAGTAVSTPDIDLSALTLDEKAALTGGEDVWHLRAIPALGLGRLRMSDGPSGLRGERRGLTRSLAFPCGTAVGATWDVDLAARYGEALAGEARDKGVHLLLGPTVCIIRTPVAGRTFESFSEDPWLTSRLAVAYIRGVQGQGVGCCVKHFVCNDQEFERMTISAIVEEDVLREIHLPAFEAAVKEAGVWAVMTAYNGLNGVPCSENEELVTGILKDEWAFDGLAVSDWLGTYHHVAPALAGLDVEMPGPARYLGSQVADAVRAGDVPEAVLDESCRRVVRLMDRAGARVPGVAPGLVEVDDPGRRGLAREIATAATVLLSNDGLLPLTDGVRRVAVIGPNADHLQSGGGGSSLVLPFTHQSLVEALGERLNGVEIVYEPGCDINRGAVPLDRRLLTGNLAMRYFHDLESNEAAGDDILWGGTFITTSAPSPAVSLDRFALRAGGTISAPLTGLWQFSLVNTGGARVLLDGKLVLDNMVAVPGDSMYGYGSAPVTAGIELVAGEEHELLIEMETGGLPVAGFSLGAQAPEQPGLLGRAEAAARDADAVILVVGTDNDWETEGRDRADISLVGGQEQLVERVLAANPRTAVIVNAGSPIEMPWADRAAANLVLWFPGEEGAPALADILTGRAEPGGRLPLTIPRRLEDVAAQRWYPGADGRVVYGEGLMVGYRHFDHAKVEPAFAFGHGLTFTNFEYGVPEVAVDGWTVSASIPVTNTGDRAGTEVVQLYVGRRDAGTGRPPQELKAFRKVLIAPGETVTVTLELDAGSLRTWDKAERTWVSAAGRFELLFAASSRDVRRRLPLDLPGVRA
ncbi:MAG: beta-glucosidase [Chloroflexota bacterium]|jgi:beta-glucosidase|nr:beta-glucosidase [Chloroflexota bacterium]